MFSYTIRHWPSHKTALSRGGLLRVQELTVVSIYTWNFSPNLQYYYLSLCNYHDCKASRDHCKWQANQQHSNEGIVIIFQFWLQGWKKLEIRLDGVWCFVVGLQCKHVEQWGDDVDSHRNRMDCCVIVPQKKIHFWLMAKKTNHKSVRKLSHSNCHVHDMTTWVRLPWLPKVLLLDGRTEPHEAGGRSWALGRESPG